MTMVSGPSCCWRIALSASALPPAPLVILEACKVFDGKQLLPREVAVIERSYYNNHWLVGQLGALVLTSRGENIIDMDIPCQWFQYFFEDLDMEIPCQSTAELFPCQNIVYHYWHGIPCQPMQVIDYSFDMDSMSILPMSSMSKSCMSDLVHGV